MTGCPDGSARIADGWSTGASASHPGQSALALAQPPSPACPAVLVQVPLMLYALCRRTFVWGGRRYRWDDKFDVTVVE